jgi:LmbE family N-acetylglucosaminyl deacetylase
LAFFEVYAGIQTLEFTPNRFVDISDVIEKKNESILCHVSQNPEPQTKVHEKMSRFRGLQCGVEHAEAFHMMGRSAPCEADAFFSPPRRYC